MARILVTDAWRGSALAIIRSLGRRGFQVVAADSNQRSPGFYSRYTEDRMLYPPPAENPNEVVSALLQAARLGGVDLIIPLTDDIILPLSAAQTAFDGLCALAIAAPEALAAAGDKLATLGLAERLGVPTPATRVVTTVSEAIEAAEALGWPVVLKPQVSRRYTRDQSIEQFSVGYADSPDSVATRIAAIDSRCPVLLQEYYRGEGYGVEMLLDAGRPLAAFQHRRLREVPFTGGASSYRESVPLDPVLLGHATRLLGELEWTGLAMVEFKVGSDGPKLMEINGRVWGSFPLAVASGMDFPTKLVELHLDGGSAAGHELDTRYHIGVRSSNLWLDLVWMASSLRGRSNFPFLPAPTRMDAVRAALSLLRRDTRFDVQSRRDPWPGLVDIAHSVSKLGSKVKHAAPTRMALTR